MPEDHFGDDVATTRYDQDSGPEFDPELIGAMIEVLAARREPPGARTGCRHVTDRLAAPARGVRMPGIELSAAMADQLSAKDRAPEWSR